MRKHIFTAAAILPLLLSVSHAAQRWTVESSQPFGIPSEEIGTGAYLGVDIMDITSDRLGVLKLKEEKGVEVTMVDQDAPAGKAGIKEHDVILTLNGTPVDSKTQLHRMIHETPPGRVVSMGLSRDGQPLTIKVQLADRSKELAHWGKDKDKDNYHVEIPPIPSIPPIPNLPDFDVPNISVVVVHSSMRSGLMVENLTPQLGEFFGAKNGSGVLVRSVEKGSRAEKAGLRAGDVITRVGDQSVHDTSDFTHALHTRSAGSVNVAVIRDRKEQTINLTLPERKDSSEMIEESLEVPELDAETQLELSQARNQITQLRPQLELAREEVGHAAEQLRASLLLQQTQLQLQAQTQIKEQQQKLREEIEPLVRKELQKSREKLQHELERMRHQLQGDWLEI